MKLVKIGEGAESTIYSVALLGLDAVLKRRMEKSYRIKEIDQKIRLQRTRKEAKIMGLVSSLGIDSPVMLLVDKYDIFMSRIKGDGLNESLNLNKRIDARKIFSALGSYAALLHNNNIIHGDYTPANVIVGNGVVYLIDFGLSDITPSIEDKALDILLMKRSVDDNNFGEFIKSYRKDCKESKLIIARLNEIEKRGRYNTRTLLVS